MTRRGIQIADGREHPEDNGLKAISATDLMNVEFEPLKWAVDGLIPEGLIIFGGTPKLGKSWLCLDLCLAVGSGRDAFGHFPTTQGKALYLSLEDSQRRLQDRIKQIWLDKEIPVDSIFSTEMLPFAEGGEEQLRDWIEANPTTRLVIIDTMEKCLPSKEQSPSYREDVERMSKLKAIADDYRISILLVHHTKKAEERDFINTLSGTTGLMGTADSTMAFQRARGESDAVLRITGRDMPEKSICLNFFDDEGWVFQCPENAVSLNFERKRILDVLNSKNLEPAGPKEITAKLRETDPSVTEESVKKLLPKLLDSGLAKRVGHGKYTLTARAERDVYGGGPDF